MKKTLLFFATLFLFTSSFASFEIKPASIKASELYVPLGNGTRISLMDLSIISIKDFQTITGKHLNFVEKISFGITQKKLRNSINNDGTLDRKKYSKFASEDGSGFNFGGFALGFFLGLIGVGIAYIINNENNQSRRKWAWIGFGVEAVLTIAAWLLL